MHRVYMSLRRNACTYLRAAAAQNGQARLLHARGHVGFTLHCDQEAVMDNGTESLYSPLSSIDFYVQAHSSHQESLCLTFWLLLPHSC
jgi:hypothetical protein